MSNGERLRRETEPLAVPGPEEASGIATVIHRNFVPTLATTND
jgi:hypothetical protein